MIKVLRYAAAAVLVFLSVFLSTQQHTAAPRTETNLPIETSVQTTSHSLADTLSYLREHQELPAFYITKSEAARLGWVPSKGNLCEVAPDRVIGGDIFTNAEHLVPSAPGRIWKEADFDYPCGGRNAKRILFSSDGLIYLTTDHYKTVTLGP